MVILQRLHFLMGLTLALQIHIFVQCQCPDEWTHHGESCYVVPDHLENWVQANVVCQLLGGYLADITSASENDFVKDLARNKDVGDVWIGGNDMLRNGKWMWAFTGQSLSYTDWAPGEPSDYNDECIQLWAGNNYLWDDVECYQSQAFVCKQAPMRK